MGSRAICSVNIHKRLIQAGFRISEVLFRLRQMKRATDASSMDLLRSVPSVDALLRSSTGRDLRSQIGESHLTKLAREVIDSLRREIINSSPTENRRGGMTREEMLSECERRLEWLSRNEAKLETQRVINATGVIIHTNLGRAPLSENARNAVAEKASGYCNLEYDISTGKRGKRGASAENLLAELAGAESALIVNNCAAAAFLVLSALGRGSEALISRGELVEIGGDFRVPDVMVQSGVRLIEVGTTNRTHLKDYENAIREKTRIIVKVHPSNYRIVGFTAAPSVTELADLAHKNNLVLYEDIGSGALFDLSDFGLKDEPVVCKSIAAGADIVTFSGDKLLGGPQAGLIAGRKSLIEKLRRYPLYRVLRVNKFVYAALEATLDSYRRKTHLEEIPVMRMISMSYEELRGRANRFAEDFRARTNKMNEVSIEVVDGNSAIGGGSAPTVYPPTALILLRHSKIPANKLDEILRSFNPPIITRILDDKILIDLRTVSKNEEQEILEALSNLQLTK